jgi:hypothetical protein
MPGTNDFLPFCGTDNGTNMLSIVNYTADAQRGIGNQPGIARSPLVNRAMRQASFIASALAQLIANTTNLNVVDAGVATTDLQAQLMSAIMGGGYVADSGAVNAYVLTLPQAPAAYTLGMKIKFVTPNANTGAATVNVSGLGLKNLTKHGSSALIGGEIPANAVVEADYDGTQFQIINVDLLSTSNAWVAGQYGSPSVLTDAATVTPNFRTANNFSWTIGGNRTLANPSNQNVGQGGIIVITQDVTGGRTLVFGSNWKFENGTVPSLTTTPLAVDVLVYYVESSSRITARLITDVK